MNTVVYDMDLNVLELYNIKSRIFVWDSILTGWAGMTAH